MKFRSLLIAAAAVVSMSASLQAVAAPTIGFSTDGGLTWAFTCADGDACDLTAAPDVVTYSGSFGSFVVNVSTGVGNNGSTINLMDLNSINMSSGAGTLLIGFSDTGFTSVGSINIAWAGTVSGFGTVEGAVWAGTSNTPFEDSIQIGSAFGPFSGPFLLTTSGLGPESGPYSITQYLLLTATGPMLYSGDFELTVPEPGTLALLGLALAGMTVARRRRNDLA